MKILVAEDDVSIAEGYKLILEHNGHQVIIAKDGSECLEVFNDHLGKLAEKTGSPCRSPFDIIILDYRMPKKDGIEVAREIRSSVPTQRILLATAYVQDVSIANLHQNALTAPVELLQKPFEFDQFLNIIENGQNASTSVHKTIAPKHSDTANPSFALSRDNPETGPGEDAANGLLSMHSDLRNGIDSCP